MSNWVQKLGFLANFAIYSGIMAAFALCGPIMYIYGKRIRAWSAGRLQSTYDQMQVDTEKARDQNYEKKDNTDVAVGASSTGS